MRKNTIMKWLALSPILFLFSCKDIIETNISSKSVVVKSPSDSVLFTSLTPTFSWEALEGATKYNIQIAKPNFQQINTLIDTTIAKTQFTKQLSTGTFQWRVRAMNVNYFTDFSLPRTIFIDSTLDIAKQQVVLLSPTQGTYSKGTVNFSWQALELGKTASITYSIKVIDSTSNQTYLSQYDLTGTTASYTFTKSATCKWYVQATDGQTGSTTIQYQKFYIDMDAPDKQTLSSDAGAIGDSVLTLNWSSKDANFLKDSLVFYAADSVTRSTVFPVYVSLSTIDSGNQYKLKVPKGTTKPTTGTVFYWQVATVDKAKNITYSKKTKFTW